MTPPKLFSGTVDERRRIAQQSPPTQSFLAIGASFTISWAGRDLDAEPIVFIFAYATRHRDANIHAKMLWACCKFRLNCSGHFFSVFVVCTVSGTPRNDGFYCDAALLWTLPGYNRSCYLTYISRFEFLSSSEATCWREVIRGLHVVYGGELRRLLRPAALRPGGEVRGVGARIFWLSENCWKMFFLPEFFVQKRQIWGWDPPRLGRIQG